MTIQSSSPTNLDQRKLLLTGIPGTGKTSVGDFLAMSQSFTHLDFEEASTLGRLVNEGNTFLNEGASIRGDVVVT
jgi:broad-specificity NMP kinase